MQRIDDIGGAQAERRQRRLFWSVCFLGWFALVAVTGSLLFLVGDLPLLLAVELTLAFWGFYALAAPAVLWLARRFPLNRDAWRSSIGVHLVGTLIFIIFCEGGFAGAVYRLEPQVIEILAARPGQPELATYQALLSQSAGDQAGDNLEGGLPKPSMRLVVFTKLVLAFPLYWVLVGMAHFLAATAALREREMQASQLAAHLTQAQLAGLRTQLQPHFLFNTLNSIAALIPRNAKLATEMVMNLSDLLRMTLREPQTGEIRLSEELKLLQHYVDIQKLRFGERLDFHVEASEEALDTLIPPLLLQPLVENAIRHGLDASDQPERIVVRADAGNQELRLEVANTFSAESAEIQPPASSTGVGLANTQARLQVQYGDHQYFQAGPLVDGGFQVTMRIPARTNLTPPLATAHEN